jgi:hypothetical protein
MADLKLARLPDRTPVKIAITVSPDLNRVLHLYADLYREIYGQAESVPELIPYMLQSFLETDRAFAKTRKRRDVAAEAPTETNATERSGRKRRAGATESAFTES